MRNSLALMLLAGACCLVFSQEAKADVNTITEVTYYEPTNSIFAWAEIMVDYDTLAYYEAGYWGQVSKDDVGLTMFNGAIYDGNDGYYEGFFPYDPDADYTIEVYPQLQAKIRHNIGDTYEDYYDYIQWTYGNSVYYPYYFGFSGPGPDRQINTASILLGAVYSIFTDGATAGPPHHLKVISDDTITLSGALSDLASCGQKQRTIKYRVVDSTGRNAGRVPVKETFPGTIVSSCTGGTVQPSSCEDTDDSKGSFTDILRTGCSSAGGSCGFDVTPDTWSWCPAGTGSPTPLARSNYSVHYNQITVRGQAGSWAGTHFYP
jgi:hypothetical protein